ncbi:MAG: hypothetical protein COT88_00700 [Candidatus Colwellbacteria bacterium CG10_big_fil_rev_8_21_14_0_10_41_28]|uniref:histidine kinase n=1 Tax=Candidatus Colwellbacteria bacterium CG10_big_fil_rev_8_21_14_0_10_41_28 TaxID=1974539 RepID=A0A2H0VHL8_9BACT|nr:MAG: hypothetical protein COT88_00700 [Candidatus Colwellbacteria bacterium CG10_big_fil_rev_8_21_14_0_10_41_28]
MKGKQGGSNLLKVLKDRGITLVPIYWFIAAIAIASAFLSEAFIRFSIILVALIPFGAWMTFKLLERKEGKEEGALSSGGLESIITNLEDAVIAYDKDFVITTFNNSAERIFRVNRERVVGVQMGPEKTSQSELKLLVQTLFPSLAPSVSTISEPNVYPQIVDISFTSPEMNLRVSTDRIIDKAGDLLGFVKVVRDRTRESKLVESKSEFVAIAAHQLRTPMTAINWTLESFSKSPNLSEQERLLAKNGYAASQNLLKTVNDLLSTTEIEGGRFGYDLQEIDLIKFFEEMLANAQISAQRYGINLYFDKGGEVEIKVMVDPKKLSLAISNLIDNGIKYNTQNGSLTVRLKRLTDKPYVEMSIKDTGVGIPPTDAEKIFTKFYRAENAKKMKADGTGLGLYIAKNIVNQHGGNIWLESTLGRGTTFYITLPTDYNLIPRAEASL